jgi:RND family efflux transporter MFP subunit
MSLPNQVTRSFASEGTARDFDRTARLLFHRCGSRGRDALGMVHVFILIPVLLVVLGSAGCSKAPAKKLPPPPMKVGVMPVEQGEIRQTLDVSGTLTFLANTTVSAEVSAQVESITVQDGQPITRGQALLIFDEMKIKESANQAQANLQRDEATMAFTRIDWEKNIELHKTGAISQTAYEQKLSAFQNAMGQVEADRAMLAKAREDLKKTKVTSPITGVLSNRYVEKGDWVSEGGKLFQVSDYSRIYLEGFISDVDVGRINLKRITQGGVDAELTVDSYPDRIFSGKLSFIQPMANQGRLFEVRIYLDNQEMNLLQGMFARGRIVVRVIPDVVRVPVQALLDQLRENDANTVFVVDASQKALLKRIKIGLTDPNYAQVVDGLNKGEVVVIQGKEILSSGQPLEAMEASRFQAQNF